MTVDALREVVPNALRGSVVRIGRHAWLRVASAIEESSTVEGSAETRHDCVVHSVVTTLETERARVAAEDVGCRGRWVTTVVALAVERHGVHVGVAVDIACSGLRVDCERRGGVVLVYLADVVIEVSFPGVGVLREVVDWGQDTDEVAARAVDTLLVPRHAISGVLGLQIVADELDGVGWETKSLLLSGAISGRQLDAEWETDEVDEADVGKNVGRVPGQLGKAVVLAGIGVVRIDSSRLDKAGSVRCADDEEAERSVTEPDSRGGAGNQKSDTSLLHRTKLTLLTGILEWSPTWCFLSRLAGEQLLSREWAAEHQTSLTDSKTGRLDQGRRVGCWR